MEVSQTRTFLKEGAYKNKGFFFYYYQIVEDYGAVWIPLFCVTFSTMRVFLLFFFLFSLFFFASAATFDQFSREQCTDVLFTNPQISLFSNFFIKNGSHDTIHIFKNYFATAFSVFNFNKIIFIQTDPR